MHILAVLGSVLAVLVIVLIRMQQAANAARDIAEAADDARGFFRRWGWRRKLIKHPLDAVDDPREAATVMMVAAAQSDGSITDREHLAITAEITKHFGATLSQADQLTARARWVVKDRHDAGEVFRKAHAAHLAHLRSDGTLRSDRDAGNGG
jgi:uncharacterized tellurite resistance protein B-like protein